MHAIDITCAFKDKGKAKHIKLLRKMERVLLLLRNIGKIYEVTDSLKAVTLHGGCPGILLVRS